jgi:hypothetical protein
MRTLQKLFLIAFVVPFPSLVFSQASSDSESKPPAGIDFSIKNVRLGTAYDDVIKNLGKPLTSRKIKTEICGEDTHLMLDYQGLKIDLVPGDKPDEFIVLEIEIASSKWLIEPNISIGSDLRTVGQKLGTPWNVAEENGFATNHYLTKGNDMADLYFQNGKLIRVRLWINPC